MQRRMERFARLALALNFLLTRGLRRFISGSRRLRLHSRWQKQKISEWRKRDISKWLSLWSVGAAVSLGERLEDHRALRFRLHRLRYTALSAWVAFLLRGQEKKKVHAALRSMRIKFIGPKVLHAFTIHVNERQSYRDLAERADRYRALNLISNALLALQDFAAERKTKRKLIGEASNLHSREILRLFWATCTRKYYEAKTHESFHTVSRNMFLLLFQYQKRSRRITELSMKVVTQWKAFTYSAKVQRNCSILHMSQDATNLSLIHQVDPPATPDIDFASEEQAKRIWEKMLTLRHEINRLKEKFHIGGG